MSRSCAIHSPRSRAAQAPAGGPARSPRSHAACPPYRLGAAHAATAPYPAHATTTDGGCAGGGRAGGVAGAGGAAAGHMRRTARSCSVVGARPRAYTVAVQERTRTRGVGVGVGAGRAARKVGAR